MQVGLISALPIPAFAQRAQFDLAVRPWRTFELTTTVISRRAERRQQTLAAGTRSRHRLAEKRSGNDCGNATRASLANGRRAACAWFYAEFDASVAAPTLTVTSKLETRNRARLICHGRNWPTLMRPRSAVPRTDRAATHGRRGAQDGARRHQGAPRLRWKKVRALYEWVIANGTVNRPRAAAVTGDIKTMLETGISAANALISTPCSSASARRGHPGA